MQSMLKMKHLTILLFMKGWLLEILLKEGRKEFVTETPRKVEIWVISTNKPVITTTYA